MNYHPHNYQTRCTDAIISQPYTALFLEMGLGKTVITLTAIQKLIADGTIRKALVVAPLTVARDTWPRECDRWDHLKSLRVVQILGTSEKRIASAESDADIYIINRENISWLVDHYGTRSAWKWDMLVLDELTSFKSRRTARTKAILKIRCLCTKIVGLTGTPDPNGLMDLFSEYLCLDGGQRLGKALSLYQEEFFTPARRNGYIVYEWKPVKGARRRIAEKVADMTITLSASDYIHMPNSVESDITVHMSPAEQSTYQRLAKTYCAEIGTSKISALSAAALYGKLAQLAGGAVYDSDGHPQQFHDRKIAALLDFVDTATSPVIVFYEYQHELARINEALHAYNPRTIKGPQDIADWNSGNVKVLLAHPASVGYGLNLQAGGHTIVWYSLPWALDQYQQANARLHRQGQTHPVMIYRLITEGTIDSVIAQRLSGKDVSQKDLQTALIDEYKRIERKRK